jgi:thioredoxin 1
MNNYLPNKPLTITDKDINESLKKYDFFVIDCWAPWCSPCRMVTPIIEQLAQEMQGKIVFGKLNVDENPQTSMEHQIMSIPTFLIFKKGNLIDRLVGVFSKEEFKKKLQLYI